MEQKPTHIEDPLTTLKEQLLIVLSTIERLMTENNVVLIRNEKDILDEGKQVLNSQQ